MRIHRSFAAALLLRGAFASSLAAGALAIGALPAAAQAQSNLPKPFVSRSLDATLMPVTPAVRSAFRLAPGDRGVLVVSTQNGGVAARSGIRAGDVISRVRGKAIDTPQQLDATVLYWLKQGTTDFGFNGVRGGRPYDVTAAITLGLFEALIDLATIGSWVSVPATTTFNYTTYYDTYDTYLVEEYATWTEEVEELSVSEEFTETVTEEYEEYFEEYTETSEEYAEESEEYSEEMEENSEEVEDEGDDDDAGEMDEGDYEDEDDGEGDYEDDDGGDDYEDDGGDEPEYGDDE